MIDWKISQDESLIEAGGHGTGDRTSGWSPAGPYLARQRFEDGSVAHVVGHNIATRPAHVGQS